MACSLSVKKHYFIVLKLECPIQLELFTVRADAKPLLYLANDNFIYAAIPPYRFQNEVFHFPCPSTSLNTQRL